MKHFNNGWPRRGQAESRCSRHGRRGDGWPRRGQATIETAFALLFFAAFLLGLGDAVRICYAWAGLQFAVNEAARYGSTGQVESGKTRVQTIEDKVNDVASGLGLSNVTVDVVDQYGNEGSAGAPLTFFRLTAKSTITLNPVADILMTLAGDHTGKYDVTGETAIRNEPFTTQ